MNCIIQRKLLELCLTKDINPLDINKIKSVALNLKMYDVIVYINNNTNEYIDFAKNYIKNKTMDVNENP